MGGEHLSAIAFMTANYVARETGWAMHGWSHGDRATNERFRPIETYAERLDVLLATIRALGFDTVDVWGAHLSPDWATDEHVAIARETLARHNLRVATYAHWVDPSNAERTCEIATAIGTNVIGGGMSGDPGAVASVLREKGVQLGIENHPERVPDEIRARIDAGDGAFGATVDTGWWATQGYDAARAIDELGERVLHVHLKDVLAVGEPHETCRWGEGIVDIAACVHALQRIGYAGTYTIEHEPEDRDPSEKCRDMLGELRSLLG